MIFKNIEIVLYSLLSSYITALFLDKTVTGFNNQKTVFIISTKGKEIASILTTKMKIAATLINAEGAWNHEEKVIVYSVIPVMRVSRLRYISQKIDPNCFITILATSEISGGKKII